tara:strand:+ start:1293 stop:2393 length:1101 start_codon:yes stop_codon:yes gene_type:complete
MAGTCYLPNGEVAQGIGQAACSAGGGRFVSTEQSTQQASLDAQPKTSNPWGTAANVALGLASLHPAGRALGWGIKGAKALKSGAPMTGRMGKLMDKMFRREKGSIVPPKQTFPPPLQTLRNQGTMPAVRASGRELSPMKMATAAGAFPVAGAAYMGRGGGAEQRALTEQNSMQSMMSNMQNLQGQADTSLATEQATEAETKRVAGLNPLEAMMENMKKPGYWTDPMNEGGPASDNRLNRMGQLMNYYGSTPKQRAAMDSPQKTFLATEQQLADNQAAFLKAQQTLSSKYGKPTVSNLATGMYDMVKEAYGDTWMPFDEKGEDELKRISTMAANIFVELSQDPRFAGASEDALRQEAVTRAGEELQL